MATFTKLAADIFAPTDDYGRARGPSLYEAQVWGTEIESLVNAFVSAGGLVYPSLSSLLADLSKATNVMAWVIGDSTVANNGVYRKSGASGVGTWVKVSGLPFPFVTAIDIGAGTANAIKAASFIPVSESSLVMLGVFRANTSSPVTVEFNGGSPLTIKTNTGDDVTEGGLVAGMRLLGVVSGSTFRLISDQVASSVAAAAEAALADFRRRWVGAFTSDAAADAYLTSVSLTKIAGTAYFNTTSNTWRYWDGSAWQTIPYATIADGSLTAAKLPAANDAVALPAIRRRLRAMPDLGDYGITSSGSTNYGQSDFNSMITALKADGYRNILVPAGNFRLGEQVTIADGVVFEGESKSASVFKFYHANSAFVFTGANENGGALKKLSIVNDFNALATAFVQLVAAVDGTSPDFFVIEDCNMTCFNSGTMSYGIIANGNARDGSAPNGLVGVRNLRFANTDIFNCTVGNVDFRHAKAPQMSGVRFFQAGGSLTKLIVGGTDSSKATTNLIIEGSTLGDVAIGFASKVIAAGCDISNVTLASGSSSCRLSTVFGTVSNAGSGNAWTT